MAWKSKFLSPNTIDEGTDEGQGLMRFEIMWVVARHAMRLIRTAAAPEAESVHLRNLFLPLAPTFGCDTLLEQLLVLRGHDDSPPAAFDALIDPGNAAFRRASIAVLK